MKTKNKILLASVVGLTLGWNNLVLAAGDRDLHAQALSVLSGTA